MGRTTAKNPISDLFRQLSNGLSDEASVECECDHGGEEEYEACGRRAKWRVSIDCQCGENHPRVVEMLCTQCLDTAREDLGNESITARPL